MMISQSLIQTETHECTTIRQGVISSRVVRQNFITRPVITHLSLSPSSLFYLVPPFYLDKSVVKRTPSIGPPMYSKRAFILPDKKDFDLFRHTPKTINSNFHLSLTELFVN